MDSKDFRKIELQSPEDLRYLLSQITEVARSSIDQHLPPGAAAADDPLRKRVEEEVLLVHLRPPPKDAGNWGR